MLHAGDVKEIDKIETQNCNKNQFVIKYVKMFRRKRGYKKI